MAKEGSEKVQNNKTDFSQGPIWRCIVAQAVPLTIAQLVHLLLQVLLDFFDYFNRITADRRANPTEDLASTIANARIDGEHLSDSDAASQYVIIATAGHDTTSSTIAGGLQALVAHPGELERLRRDPELIPSAVEEMIRWVTPVK